MSKLLVAIAIFFSISSNAIEFSACTGFMNDAFKTKMQYGVEPILAFNVAPFRVTSSVGLFAPGARVDASNWSKYKLTTSSISKNSSTTRKYKYTDKVKKVKTTIEITSYSKSPAKIVIKNKLKGKRADIYEVIFGYDEDTGSCYPRQFLKNEKLLFDSELCSETQSILDKYDQSSASSYIKESFTSILRELVSNYDETPYLSEEEINDDNSVKEARRIVGSCDVYDFQLPEESYNPTGALYENTLPEIGNTTR